MPTFPSRAKSETARLERAESKEPRNNHSDSDNIAQVDLELPCNVASERVVLGCLIEDGKLVPSILETGITADDFSLSDHGRVFQSILNLRQQSVPVDCVSVVEELGKSDRDIALLADVLHGAVVEASHATHHARIVMKKAQLREFMKFAEWMQTAAIQPGADPELLVSTAIGKLQEVSA